MLSNLCSDLLKTIIFLSGNNAHKRRVYYVLRLTSKDFILKLLDIDKSNFERKFVPLIDIEALKKDHEKVIANPILIPISIQQIIIRKYVDTVNGTFGFDKKSKYGLNMFEYVTSNEGLVFVNKYPEFRKVLLIKFQEYLSVCKNFNECCYGTSVDDHSVLLEQMRNLNLVHDQHIKKGGIHKKLIEEDKMNKRILKNNEDTDKIILTDKKGKKYFIEKSSYFPDSDYVKVIVPKHRIKKVWIKKEISF